MPSPGGIYHSTYPGGWQNDPVGATPIDAAALENMEGGIRGSLQAPTSPASGDLPIWDPTANSGQGGWNTTTNVKIAKSMLGALGIVDADVSVVAAIQLSKLNGFPNDATKFARGDGVWASVVGIPTGVILAFATSTAPSGWLLTDGSAVSRSTFSALFALIGTTYGSGDGSTTFNVPDIRDKIPLGKGATHSTLGATGGEETHVLSVGEMPSHNHGGATGGQSADHDHIVNYWWSGSGPSSPLPAADVTAAPAGPSAQATGGTSNDHTHAISAQGGGAAHNNLQPYIVLPYIIKT